MGLPLSNAFDLPSSVQYIIFAFFGVDEIGPLMSTCREMWYSVNESVKVYVEQEAGTDLFRHAHVQSKTMLIRELLSGFKLDKPRTLQNLHSHSFIHALRGMPQDSHIAIAREACDVTVRMWNLAPLSDDTVLT
jgi:hypothetical protein